VARDRLGIKPLYYRKQNNSFYFSSELYSILRMSGTNSSISAAAVDMYLWLQFVPTPYSAIDNIYKLPPGHYIRGNFENETQIDIAEYWNAYQELDKPVQEHRDLETVLRNSLDRQLHADVPLGLFLSSGVDSSLLAAMVNKYFSSGSPVNFFTVQFEENTALDESRDAGHFINGFNNPNLHCSTITVNPKLISDRLETLYDYYDEPFGDHASLLNWMISQKAREFVTVAISGDGADELFWGYDRYKRWQKFSQLNKLPLFAPLAKTAAQFLPAAIRNNVRFVTEQDPVKRHFNFFLPSGMRFRIADHITKYPMWSLQGAEKLKDRNDLPAVLDIKTYLADAMLYKVDRSSMASSLEVRVPYLDNEVLDLALAMPLHQKSNSQFASKAPLKELLGRLVPHYPLHQPKKGFSFPLGEWLKKNWKQQVLDTVNRADLEDAGLDAGPYLALVNDFYNNRNNYFTDVWYIFNLCLWIRKIKTISHT